MKLVKEPIYQQLCEQLRLLIRSEEFRSRERFLTERAISERFDVSRTTANKAVSALVSEGVLELRKGIGTFIRGGVLEFDLGQLVSFTERARGAGKKPGTKVLTFRKIQAAETTDIVRDMLEVSGKTPLFLLERLRLVDRVPVICERRFIVCASCPRLSRSDVAESLYTSWTRRYGLRIGGADQTISAVQLSKSESDLLKARSGSPALMVVAKGFLDSMQPLWWERTLYRADCYVFQNHVRNTWAGVPAAGYFLDPQQVNELVDSKVKGKEDRR